MKPGATVLTPAAVPGFPAVVDVGDNDRAVRVKFGAITIYLSNMSDPAVVIVRAEGHDTHGRAAPVESRAATDVQNQIEYRLAATTEAQP